MRDLIYSLFFFSMIASSAFALPSGPIGKIQTLQGTASVLRESRIIPLQIGTLLYKGDLVRTAKPGAVGIVLTDDTTISLGPNSELSLTDVVFDPKEGKFSLVTRMVKGTFSYLSGMIGKLAPNAVQLIVPDATIAVRGTKLLITIEE